MHYEHARIFGTDEQSKNYSVDFMELANFDETKSEVNLV